VVGVVEHSDLAAFADDHVNLHRPERERKRAKVAELRERLEQKIKAEPTFPLEKMRHAGSVEKGTALSNVTDLDVVAYCRAAAAPTKDAEIVAWMTDRLREAYPDLRDAIKADTHCTTITFSAMLKVDVVPVLSSGSDDNGYLIAKDGERLFTNVSQHLEFVRARKTRLPDHYAQVVRFMKWWARLRKDEDPANFKCKSFLLELLVAHLADRAVDLTEYPTALARVFAYICQTGLRERIAFTDYYPGSKLPRSATGPIEIFDPVNPTNNVAIRYTESDRTRLVTLASEALDAITEALYASTKERAVRRWQVVLGPTFRGGA
jgi:tRNA nucleotidyltransferase (CCA-adding enzyme)